MSLPPTRLIPISTGFRLLVLTEEVDIKQVYDFLATWSIGPFDTTWRTFNPLQDTDAQNLTKGKAWASQRPGDSSRSGFLCIYPPWKCVLYAEADKQSSGGKFSKGPRVFILQLRVDPSVFSAGGIIYSATLVGSEKRLIMEDLLFCKGFPTFFKKPFSERWRILQESLQNDIFVDEDLVGGLTVSLRSIQPLAEITQFGVWEILPEEAGRRRLLWFLPRGAPKITAGVVTSGNNAIGTRGNVMQIKESMDKAILKEAELKAEKEAEEKGVAVATKGAFPDQYFLSSKGVKLGMAIIQNPEVSKQLRILSKVNPQFKVRIGPASEFAGSWEILSIY